MYPHVGNNAKYEYSSEESNSYPHGQSSIILSLSFGMLVIGCLSGKMI